MTDNRHYVKGTLGNCEIIFTHAMPVKGGIKLAGNSERTGEYMEAVKKIITT